MTPSIAINGTCQSLIFQRLQAIQTRPRDHWFFNLKNKPQATIRLSVTSKYGCLSDTASVLVKRIPDFSIGTSANAGCTPFDPQLTGTCGDPVDQVSYSWDFGDGTTGNGDKVKHEYTEPDRKYDIILTALSSTTGCSDTLMSPEFVWVMAQAGGRFQYG